MGNAQWIVCIHGIPGQPAMQHVEMDTGKEVAQFLFNLDIGAFHVHQLLIGNHAMRVLVPVIVYPHGINGQPVMPRVGMEQGKECQL